MADEEEAFLGQIVFERNQASRRGGTASHCFSFFTRRKHGHLESLDFIEPFARDTLRIAIHAGSRLNHPSYFCSRFAHSRVMVFRSLARSASISVNFSTIDSTWAESRTGQVLVDHPHLRALPQICLAHRGDLDSDCRKAIATGTAQRVDDPDAIDQVET